MDDKERELLKNAIKQIANNLTILIDNQKYLENKINLLEQDNIFLKREYDLIMNKISK